MIRTKSRRLSGFNFCLERIDALPHSAEVARSGFNQPVGARQSTSHGTQENR